MSNDDKEKGRISSVAAEAADDALGLFAERLRSNDKNDNSEKASQSPSLVHSKSDTSAGSTGSKTDLNDSTPDDTTDDLAASTSAGIVFHEEKNFECSVNYWRVGLKLPESGKIHLASHQFAFKGIAGTKLAFEWGSLEIEKVSRMGLMNNAFRILVHQIDATTPQPQDVHAYLFTTILKDRKLVYEKIQQAISDANNRTKHAVQQAKNNTQKVRQQPFQIPPDLVIQKMTRIGCKRLKNVSLQVSRTLFVVAF